MYDRARRELLNFYLTITALLNFAIRPEKTQNLTVLSIVILLQLSNIRLLLEILESKFNSFLFFNNYFSEIMQSIQYVRYPFKSKILMGPFFAIVTIILHNENSYLQR